MSARLLPEDDPDVIDMHVARILAMSDDEIRAEVIAEGKCPEAEAARMRAEVAKAFVDFQVKKERKL